MAREQAGEFDQRLLDLYDRYTDEMISRRQFLEQAARYAVGGLSAAGLPEMLSARYALARRVAPDDARLHAAYVEYSSPRGYSKVRAYSTRPAGTRFPAS